MKTPLRCLLLALTSLASAESGGPDIVGYAYDHTSSPQPFQSIVGTAAAILVFGGGVASDADDSDTNAQLGFTFPFYGVNYTQVHFNTNGLICLGGTGTTAFTNVDLTTTNVAGDLPAIAVYWDDLIFRAGQPGGLWVKQRTVDGLKEFVVEWFDVATIGATSDLIGFQAILREDGSITCHYPYVDIGGGTHDRGASATIGIRDVDGHTNGRLLQATFNSGAPYLTSGDRIDFRVLPDTRATALDFTGRTTSPRVFTSPASADAVEDPDIVPGVAEGKSVWFLWHAPTNGNVSFSTAGSNFDTVLAVFDASSIAPTLQGTDDDGGGDTTSRAGPIACYGNETFLIMVAGKDVSGTITSGLAQVTASFTPVEHVGFYFPTRQYVEGQSGFAEVRRDSVNGATLDVEVQITDPDGGVTTQMLHADGNDYLSVVDLTFPDDAVFTPGRFYTLTIVPHADRYIANEAEDTMTIEVLDNDPPAVTATKFCAALFARTPNGNGILTLNLGRTGAFTGQLTQGLATFAFKGQMDAFGRAVVTIAPTGQAVRRFTLTFAAGGTRVSSGDFGLSSLAPVPFNARNPVPAAQVGRYSLYRDSSLLPGFTFGTGTVAASGAVKFAGTLFDGTKFSFGTKLNASSQIDAYARTHGGKGFITLVQVTLGSISGYSAIMRPGGLPPDKVTTAFAAGYFETNGSPLLSRYNPPLPGAQPSAGFTTSQGAGLFLTGDSSPLDLLHTFTLAPTGLATSPTAGFTLKMDRKTGLYRGTRPNPTPGGKPIAFSGVLAPTSYLGDPTGIGYGISHEPTVAQGAYIQPGP